MASFWVKDTGDQLSAPERLAQRPENKVDRAYVRFLQENVKAVSLHPGCLPVNFILH